MFHSCFMFAGGHTGVGKKSKKATNRLFFTWALQNDFSLDSDSAAVCHMCFPVRKKSGRSSLALAVWNSSLSLNLHSSSSSSLLTVCLRELRSALMTHRVAPTEEQTWQRGQTTYATVILYVWWSTFEEREVLEEPRSHEGVSETEQKATKKQPHCVDVVRMRSGTHETHRHLQANSYIVRIFTPSTKMYECVCAWVCVFVCVLVRAPQTSGPRLR